MTIIVIPDSSKRPVLLFLREGDLDMLGIIVGIIITIVVFSVFGPVAGVCWILFGLLIAHLTR